jgi:hypothetical protein
MELNSLFPVAFDLLSCTGACLVTSVLLFGFARHKTKRRSASARTTRARRLAGATLDAVAAWSPERRREELLFQLALLRADDLSAAELEASPFGHLIEGVAKAEARLRLMRERARARPKDAKSPLLWASTRNEILHSKEPACFKVPKPPCNHLPSSLSHPCPPPLHVSSHPSSACCLETSHFFFPPPAFVTLGGPGGH